MLLTSLTAYQFTELVRKVDAHIGRNSGSGITQSVRLDYDGQYLHAVATDRYTLAVARERATGTAPAWAVTISAAEEIDHVGALRAWADAHFGEEHIHLSTGTEGLTATSSRGKLVVAASTGYFPEWRDLIRTALQHEATESPYSGFQPKLLARWSSAGKCVTTWQSAIGKPLVIYGTNFVGLQMPMRLPDEESLASRWEEWKGSLGEKGPAVEQEQTLDHWEAVALEEKETVVADAAADLLKQVLHSTTDVFQLATGDTGALTAYALAGGRAWMAYRLLKALEKAAPDLLFATLADTDEQLESGEIGEWAWDEAQRVGHDPQKWHDEYEARLKKRAAEAEAATAEPAAAGEAAT